MEEVGSDAWEHKNQDEQVGFPFAKKMGGLSGAKLQILRTIRWAIERLAKAKIAQFAKIGIR